MTEISINDSNMLITENKKDDNFYYYKLVYLIITTIICFLGILIIFENFNLFFFSTKTFKNIVLFFIIYNSFSWLIIYLLALILYKNSDKCFTKNIYNEEASGEDLDLKQITNQNTLFNKCSNQREQMLNKNINLGKFNTENKDLDIINLEKNRELPINNSDKIFTSTKFKNHIFKSNVTLNNINANLHVECYENKNVNLNSANNENALNPFSNRSNYILKFIYFNLLLINYSVISIIGIIILLKLYKQEVFKNYKLYYKIYLFVLLSLTKSAIIVIGFIYKFVSRKIESNSKKFDLNEEFLKEIEKEIQEANKISGIISPEKNLIKYNDMFNRQDFNKISSFNLFDSNRNSKLEKNSADNLIFKDEIFLNNELNIDLNNSKTEREKVNNQNNNKQFINFESNPNKKDTNYFNFRIGENPVNFNETESRKSNIKMKSEKKFKLGIESAILPLNSNGNNVNENKKKFKKSFSNINTLNKNIIIDDLDLLNNKIDLEKLEPSNFVLIFIYFTIFIIMKSNNK